MDRAVEEALREDLTRGLLPALTVGPAPEQDSPVAVTGDHLSVRTGSDPDAGDVRRCRITEGHDGRRDRSRAPAEVPELGLLRIPRGRELPAVAREAQREGRMVLGRVVDPVREPPASGLPDADQRLLEPTG